eukprot:2405464-Heterocapsa_arctica.AAC.1
MPGERQAVAGALEVRACALAVVNARCGSSGLLIIPKLCAGPTGAETPARRGRRAHIEAGAESVHKGKH